MDEARGQGGAPLDPERWADDPRLCAFALGELEGEEHDLVARLVAEHDDARRMVDELRGTARDLEAALAAEAGVVDAALTPRQRSVVAASARAQGSATRGWGWRRIGWQAGVAAAAVLTGTVTLLLFKDGLGTRDDVLSGRAMAPGSPAPSQAKLGRRGIAPQAGGAVKDARADARDGLLTDAASLDPLTESEVDLGEALDDDVAPKPQLDREGYERIVENPFVPTAIDPRSTFSIDVDTASYTNVRRMLSTGQRVPPDAVRVEELVNYFPYDYEAPAQGAAHPFAVHVDVAAAPWAPRHRLVRIGLAAEKLDLAERPQANLVFLLDVSGSMNDPMKLPLVKRALALLVEQLGEEDRVAIVVYASAEGLALPSVSGGAREVILQAIERLNAGGSTNGGAGIQLAYATAREHFVPGGINRVILCTDGDFNVGLSSDGDLERLIEQEAKSGVFLTVLGFGSGNWQDAKMEKLSNRGNGNFAYIDSLLEARRVLVEEVGGTLATVAKDVKIQVEFNPLEVQAARLIGYENRVLAHQDFVDDEKDAGEIGAGHTVTALYEIVPVGVPFAAAQVPESRYSEPAPPSAAARGGELLTVRLRYKRPEGDVSTQIEVPVRDGGASFDQAGDDTRFAAAVAAFGMVLRGSEHVGRATLDDVRRWAIEALGPDRGGYREGFVELVERARAAAPR